MISSSVIILCLTIVSQQTFAFLSLSPTTTLSSPWHQCDGNYCTDRRTSLLKESSSSSTTTEHVDIAIVGAGIGGLCAGAILNTLYNKKVGIYESHYLPGGCAHAFPHVVNDPNHIDNNDIDNDNDNAHDAKKGKKVRFIFDSGPTIVLGCSKKPYNPLRQVLNAIGLDQEVDWIPYTAWGMIEHPNRNNNNNNNNKVDDDNDNDNSNRHNDDDPKEKRWRVELGPDLFEQGPLSTFGGVQAQTEFQELRALTKDLVSGAIAIPAMAMRAGDSAIIPLLRFDYLPSLIGLIQQGTEATQGTFAPYMDGPKYVVKSQWLRDWLDALAFSLSGLPASRTAAAAMAYVLYDMHRDGAALDYPKGGLGTVIDALVNGVEQGKGGSRVHLRSHVQSIDTTDDGREAVGLTLKNGKKVIAKDGVICNAPVWALTKLIGNDNARSILNTNGTGNDDSNGDGERLEKKEKVPTDRRPRQSWTTRVNDKRKNVINFERPSAESSGDDDASLLAKCDTSEQTGSFLHLHVALNSTDLDLDSLEAHYTVMDRGLSGDDDGVDGPCGELNMIAVSNPCVLDRSLAPEGYIVVHAYGAGNEPYEMWENLERNSQEYKDLKEERAAVLWNAIESIIPDARERTVTSMIGSPLTHERFLRRPRGTYGSATEDYLKDGRTPIKGLVLCGDGVFPGIGVPAVALSGASAANAMVSPFQQWICLDDLKAKNLI